MPAERHSDALRACGVTGMGEKLREIVGYQRRDGMALEERVALMIGAEADRLAARRVTALVSNASFRNPSATSPRPSVSPRAAEATGSATLPSEVFDGPGCARARGSLEYDGRPACHKVVEAPVLGDFLVTPAGPSNSAALCGCRTVRQGIQIMQTD